MSLLSSDIFPATFDLAFGCLLLQNQCITHIRGADFNGCIEVVLSVRPNAINTILVSDLVSDN